MQDFTSSFKTFLDEIDPSLCDDLYPLLYKQGLPEEYMPLHGIGLALRSTQNDPDLFKQVLLSLRDLVCKFITDAPDSEVKVLNRLAILEKSDLRKELPFLHDDDLTYMYVGIQFLRKLYEYLTLILKIASTNSIKH